MKNRFLPVCLLATATVLRADTVSAGTNDSGKPLGMAHGSQFNAWPTGNDRTECGQ